MSALAQDALAGGYSVTGSDLHYNSLMEKLKVLGAGVYEGNMPEKAAFADTVVFNSAIKDDDPELLAARSANKPCLTRSDYLGVVSKKCARCAAVSGIHGKSTTTGLISAAFKRAGTGFTAHICAEVNDIGGNYFTSGREWFVTEACEYKGSFLSLEPDIAAALNIELDHPDYYRSEKSVFDTFRLFAENIKKGGSLIIRADARYKPVYDGLKGIEVFTFGLDKGFYSARNLKIADKKYAFDLYADGKYIARIKNNLYGGHNVYNALACAAVSDRAGLGFAAAIEAIENFGGVKRRFEEIGSYGNCKLISDYAHHPNEIRAVLKSAKEAFGDKILVCFQPHTYSRTAKLFRDFLHCFDAADGLIIFKEYPARESEKDGKSAYQLFQALDDGDAEYIDDAELLKKRLKEKSARYACALLLGAGDMEEFFRLST